MIDRVVAARYAEAFLQCAKGTIGLQNGVGEVLALRQVFSDSPQFKSFLESPDFSEREKFAIIDRVILNNFESIVGHFLKLLVDKGRIRNLADILEYIRMTYGHGDMVSAVLASAFPVDDDLVTMIKEKLERRIQRRINLYVTFDSELLGGVKVTIGNQVFDGSLKRQLAEFREKSTHWRTE